jgi:methionyl-tRNA formyltransferase
LLESRHEVVAVLTRPDARAGRGRTVTASPVAALAREAGIEVLTPPRPSDPDFRRRLVGLAPDCCPVVAYGALLPASALSVPPHGWINLHFSLLPAWRGAAPVQAAIWHGDEVTGATTFRIEAGLDTGPTYGMLTEPIRPDDTSGALLDRLAGAGAGLLAATLDGIEDGTLVARPQPDDGVSVAPKLTVTDARVDWTVPAFAIDRRVRACTPEPGAWSTFRGQRIKLGPVRPHAAVASPGPGVLVVERSRVLVGTAAGCVELGEVRPEGRKPTVATDWTRGIRPEEGERCE